MNIATRYVQERVERKVCPLAVVCELYGIFRFDGNTRKELALNINIFFLECEELNRTKKLE